MHPLLHLCSAEIDSLRVFWRARTHARVRFWNRLKNNPETRRFERHVKRHKLLVVPRRPFRRATSSTSAMAVPTHSAWFRLDSVDDIEKRALPEFFDGSSSTKTPAAYTHMRNLMVSTFREAPNLHLSATECRRHIAADVGSVMRLHQFLEHWGIINTSTAARPPAGASALNGGGGGAAPLSAELSLRAPLAVVGGEWTAQETLGLVEALERANTGEGEQTWDDIALQVGKSAEACVTHFLSPD